MRRAAALMTTGILALAGGACNGDGDGGGGNTTEAFCEEAEDFRTAFERFEQQFTSVPTPETPEQLADQLRPVVDALDGIMASADDMLGAAPDAISDEADTLRNGIRDLFGEYRQNLEQVIEEPEALTEDPQRAAELVTPPELDPEDQQRFDEAGDAIRDFTLEECDIDLENLGEEEPATPEGDPEG